MKYTAVFTVKIDYDETDTYREKREVTIEVEADNLIEARDKANHEIFKHKGDNDYAVLMTINAKDGEPNSHPGPAPTHCPTCGQPLSEIGRRSAEPWPEDEKLYPVIIYACPNADCPNYQKEIDYWLEEPD